MGNELEKRLRQMSDEDLLDMIDKNPEDYEAEAIRIAREEAERRGGLEKLYEIVESKYQKMYEEGELEAGQEELGPEYVDDSQSVDFAQRLFSGTRTLKDETISEVQYILVPGAADYAGDVIDDIKKKLKASNMPLDCRWGVVEVKTKGWISRVRRDFLIVELSEFPDYHTYISVRGFGTYLDCMRALTVEPGFVKKFISKKLTGDADALSAPKNILKHQDLNTWNEIVKDCMNGSIDDLVQRMEQKPTRLQQGEKKFLEVW